MVIVYGVVAMLEGWSIRSIGKGTFYSYYSRQEHITCKAFNCNTSLYKRSEFGTCTIRWVCWILQETCWVHVGAKNTLCYWPSSRGGAMAMQCNKKPQLLRNVQIQALAVESEKTEAEDSVEVCKKWEVATMTDILKIVSVCGQISWNNSTNDWPASSLQHCACIRLLRQVTEQGEANKSLNTRLVSVVNFVWNF